MSEKLIGKTLAGRFVLEEVLGTGATGAVFRAQQTSVDRVVAVKTLHPFLQEREDFKARFEIEAKAIARLNHPNCITLYDFGYDEEFDVFYMAVEYIEGEQLGDMMAETIPYEDVLMICYQVADALEHAHREGILHRDLKPENIMVRVLPDSGRQSVKVLDFGLARLYETAVDEDDGEEAPTGRYKQITQAGQVYGTPAYMSPEQCRANSELTPATDIYALGTMMYELLEGHLPFFSKSTAELIMMQMTEDPPRMERLDVPEEIRDLIFQMMQKDPAARPQTAKEVLLALLSHVRLDASQELRILPNASGELARLTPEQLKQLSAQAAEASGERPKVQTLELSNDELRVATRRGGLGVVLAIVAVIAVIGAAIGILSGNDRPMRSPATVDSAAANVADSPTENGEEGDDPVEVAKSDRAKKRSKKEHKRPRKRSKKPASEATDEADVGDVPAPAEKADRPKTLKLEY